MYFRESYCIGYKYKSKPYPLTLNALIDCEIHVKQPQGYEIYQENCEPLVYKL